MIGIDIDMRSDAADVEAAEVFVRASGGSILMTENPALAIAYKVEAVIALLRDIESDFGMLALELREDNNRVICEALQRRVKMHTDTLEDNLTQHTTADSVLETFGYMWSKDYTETLFLPAFRKDVIDAIEDDGADAERFVVQELARMKAANGIVGLLDGELDA